jgi:hypothetical protein
MTVDRSFIAFAGRLAQTPRTAETPKELEAVRPLHRTLRSAHRTLSLPEFQGRSKTEPLSPLEN